MKRLLVVFFIAVVAVASASADESHRAPQASDDARFEFLKSLAGSWLSESGKDGEPGMLFEFRVTAGGHAVEEREMVGTPMEMVTLYHMRGKDLVATHYCMLGNQPRLKAEEKLSGNSLAFGCDGVPGNAASHDEEHVHGWSIKLDGEGRLLYDAELVKEGKVTESPRMVLTRKVETASR